MRSSLKKYLTINAIIIVILSIMVAITATFLLRQEAARLHLDAELSLEAHLIESMLTTRLSSKRIKQIQTKINNLAKNDILGTKKAQQSALAHRAKFQVWDLTNNKLVLHSPNAPFIPLNQHTGYHIIHLNTSLWRTYNYTLTKSHYKIVTFQRHDKRLHHEKQFFTDTLIVLAIGFSFLIFALSLIIQSGLSVLNETKLQLEKREPDNLNPIDTSNTPLEVKPLIQEINRLMAQLKSALEREHQFAANAAHELKTPLSTMKAQIQLALRQPTNKQIETFKSVESSIDRYDHIIKQLLTLSRTISQASLETSKPTSLLPVIQNAIAPLVPYALERNISLEFQHSITPILHINEILISTAIHNLIENAIKYSNPNDTIIIHLYNQNNQIIIDIIDHGSGILNKDKELVLQRFKRLDQTAQGSGLGLNIVMAICKQINGKLSLKDTPKGGLTVSISLPED